MIRAISANSGSYRHQWGVKSFTGRIDEDTGDVAEYTVSETQRGEYQCGCGAWKFQRRWLNHGILIPKVERDYYTDECDGHCKHIVYVLNHHSAAVPLTREVRTSQYAIRPISRLEGLYETL